MNVTKMNVTKKLAVVLFTGVALPLAVYAHDPSEHAVHSEKPDCSAMKDMDHSHMDMSDPVAMALMKKCMNEAHGDAAEHHHDDGEEHSHMHEHEDSDSHAE